MYKNKTGFHRVSCEANYIDISIVRNKVIYYYLLLKEAFIYIQLLTIYQGVHITYFILRQAN